MRKSQFERGVTIIEYALLLAVVVIGIIVVFDTADLPTAINGVLTKIKNCLSGVSCP